MLSKSEIGPLLQAGLRADFHRAYSAAMADLLYGRLATVISTDRSVQRYGWLGDVPTMREFVDERQPAGLRSHEYSIEDKVWESSIAVDRRAMEDDQLGAIRLRVQGLGREAARHKDRVVVGLITSGFSDLCYDGTPLIGSTHSEGDSGTQSNVGSDALSAESLQAAIAAMMGVKNDRAEPLGIRPDLMLVGPQLMFTARELLQSAVVVEKGDSLRTPYTNVLKGLVDLVVSPDITDTSWYLMDTSRPMRGVILQERSDVPVELVSLEDASRSESVFLRDQYLFGVRSRFGAGYGLWQAVWGSTGG